MKLKFTILTFTLIMTQSLFGQLDSIYEQNVWRTFFVHLPDGYSANSEYPIVLNLHGLGSNSTQQQLYTQFNSIADNKGFIVVYPNSISNSWTTIGNSDIDFLSHLVDTIRTNYATDNCLFLTGMSQGGFMSYKFAYSTSHTVNAIAVGSGNMSNATQNSSTAAPQIPVIHFHGTADASVPYAGTAPFIPHIDTTIKWLVEHNNCNTTPIITTFPNSNLFDNSTVEKHYYSGTTINHQVTFYKVLNGGHTWSGATPAPLLGATNQDIDQSAIIGDFFETICSETNSINQEKPQKYFSVFPNPFLHQVTITATNNEKNTITIYDHLLHPIITETFVNSTNINTDNLPRGIYFYEIQSSKTPLTLGKLIKN